METKTDELEAMIKELSQNMTVTLIVSKQLNYIALIHNEVALDGSQYSSPYHRSCSIEYDRGTDVKVIHDALVILIRLTWFTEDKKSYSENRNIYTVNNTGITMVLSSSNLKYFSIPIREYVNLDLRGYEVTIFIPVENFNIFMDYFNEVFPLLYPAAALIPQKISTYLRDVISSLKLDLHVSVPLTATVRILNLKSIKQIDLINMYLPVSLDMIRGEVDNYQVIYKSLWETLDRAHKVEPWEKMLLQLNRKHLIVDQVIPILGQDVSSVVGEYIPSA